MKMKSFLLGTMEHTFVFGLGGILQRVISFLLLPIYLHNLTPSDYGILALLDIIAMLFGSIILQGLPTSVFRAFSYDYLNQETEQKEVVGSAYLHLIISPLIFYGLLYLLAPQISEFFFKNSTGENISLVRLTFITGIFAASTNIPFAVMRAKLQSKFMIVVSIVRLFVNVSFNIYFVVFLQMNVAGIVWGNLITQFLMFIASPLLLSNSMVWKISINKLKEMLLFGWPIIPSSIAGWILSSADRYFIEHFSTTSELGLYSLGFQISSVLTVVILQPFRTVWPAIFYPKSKEQDAPNVFGKFFTYFLLITSVFGLCLIAGAEPMIQLLGPKEYWHAHVVVPILVFCLILGDTGVQSIITIGLYLQKKTKYVPIIVAIGALINIVLNWLLVPRYGMMGAAVATLVCSILMTLMCYLLNTIFYPIKLEMKRICHLTIILILLVILNYHIAINSFILMIVVKSILIIMFPILLYLTHFFDDQEKNVLKSIREKGLSYIFEKS